MKRDVQDLRILRLAQTYEDAFEAFVRQVAEQMGADETVRARLERLAPRADAHGVRLRRLIEKVEARLGPDDAPEAERAAILDVVEVEVAAREFDLRHLEELHDPEAVALFRELLREEGEHVRIAEQVLDALDARHRKASPDPRVRRIHDLVASMQAGEAAGKPSATGSGTP